jgi:DNA-binding transcriptional LysR family regulator
MRHPTINSAAAAIGIDRATLIEQLHRLETDLGTSLYHRATSDGQPHQPTSHGRDLLAALNRADVQPLRAKRARLPRHTTQPTATQ